MSNTQKIAVASRDEKRGTHRYAATKIDSHVYTCGCGGCLKCEAEQHPDTLRFTHKKR